jgi:cytoskeletal protein RodZ
MNNLMENNTKQSEGGELVKKRNGKKIIIGIILFVILGAWVAVSAFLFYQFRQSKESLQAEQKKEVSSVITTINKHVLLPTDEQPTLATVTDIKKLKGQQFFKKAANGDKVLIYAKAQKAILYRPSTDMIIEFAPLILDATAPESAKAVSTPSPLLTPTPIQSGPTIVEKHQIDTTRKIIR